MALSSNELFRAIDAPLKNVHSWGAIHETNSSVILRVWRDQSEMMGNQRMFRLTCKGKWDKNNRFPYKERKRHIKLIQEGDPGFMIVHTSTETMEKCGARTITGWDRRIWQIDRIVKYTDKDNDVDLWGLVKGKPVDIPVKYKTLWKLFGL